MGVSKQLAISSRWDLVISSPPRSTGLNPNGSHLKAPLVTSIRPWPPPEFWALTSTWNLRRSGSPGGIFVSLGTHAPAGLAPFLRMSSTLAV